MPSMTKTEIIDEMVSEGYDYDSAWRMVYGEVSDNDYTNQDNSDTAV